MAMSSVEMSGTFALGDLRVRRLGLGAMHLSGPGVFGPPEDRAGALAVLREAVASGVCHIDTSDYYGPHVTNRLIHEALYPCSVDRNRCERDGSIARHCHDSAVGPPLRGHLYELATSQ